jgi:hypothetical protein
MPELKTLKPMSKALKEQEYAMRKIKTIPNFNLEERKMLKKIEPLPTAKDKETELEDLLSESEKQVDAKKIADAKKEKETYARLEKQGMSDQGIVSPKELKEFGKDVYKGAKAGVKKVAKGAMEAAKSGVKKVKEYME